MSSTPAWVSIAQLFLTAFLGLGAAAIAFMQWRTAHQKVVLDLFEKRTVALAEFEDICFSAGRQPPDAMRILQSGITIRYLFGDEIYNIASDVLRKINREKSDTDPELLYHAIDVYSEVVKKSAPYLRMHQRMVRTPLQWFRDRNELRKSFGDQPAEGPPEGGPAA